MFYRADQASKAGVVKAVTTIFRAIHKHGVLHRDAEPRNILYDGGRLMVVDFERAESHGRHQPLGSIDANSRNLRKKRGQNAERDEFARELEYAVAKASTCLASPRRRYLQA